MGNKSTKLRSSSSGSRSSGSLSRSSSFAATLGTRRKSSVGNRVSGAVQYGSTEDIKGRSRTSSSHGTAKNGALLDGNAEHKSSTNNEFKPTHLPRSATKSFLPIDLINQLEISSPEEVRTLPVNLLDGSLWALRYCHVTDRFRHGMIRMRRANKLEHDGAFSFFVVHDGLVSGELLPVEDEHLVKEEIQSWTAEQMGNDYLFSGGGLVRSKHLVVRRRVYFRESSETREALLAADVSSMAHTLAFIDAAYTFRRGWYHQTSEQLVEAASLLYNALSVHNNGIASTTFDADLLVEEVLPHVCITTTPDALEDLVKNIRTRWKSGVHQLNGLQSEQIFCQKLSKWAPWYGSIIFSVTDHATTTRFKYMAATEEGVYILKRGDGNHTGDIAVEKYATWSTIQGWNLSENGSTLSLTVSNVENKNTLKNATWMYDVKAGNAVTIIDQLIEYSHAKKMAFKSSKREDSK